MAHPADVPKPPLTVADLHLFGKYLFEMVATPQLSDDEEVRCDDLYGVLDDYLTAAVGADWRTQEALV